MAHEPILILDPDAASRNQLTQLLTSSGYDVYGVVSADRLVDAVTASPFPAVMIDIWLPNIDRGALISAIHDASPHTSVIVMGEQQVFTWLLEVFREGAADFVQKPFDPIEVRERLSRCLAKRQRRLAELQALANQGSVVRAIDAPPSASADLVQEMRDFQDRSLELFLDIERRNLELEKELSKRNDLGGSEETAIHLLPAHSDPKLTQSLKDRLERIDVHLEQQAYTGGGVLDRIASLHIDMLVVGTDLPDIPGEIVASSIKSEYPDLEVLILDTNCNPATIRYLIDSMTESEPKEIHNPVELIDAIGDRAQEIRDRELARRFASEFQGKHSEYIRAVASLKRKLEEAG